MTQPKTFPALFVSLLLAGLCMPAASDVLPQGAFVEIGAAERAGAAVTVGVSWPWSWKRDWFGGEVTASTEAFASHWSTRATGGGREGTSLLGVTPLLRYRFSQGRSPWFLEGGVGVSWMDSKYTSPDKQFSTSFNFYDSLAVGRNFGDGSRQEMSLRITHISNAAIKQPNPGEEFVQLRYAMRF